MTRGGEPADGTPLLLGITKASLSTDSFISVISWGRIWKINLTQDHPSPEVDFPDTTPTYPLKTNRNSSTPPAARSGVSSP